MCTIGFYSCNSNFHRCHWQPVCSLKFSGSRLSACLFSDLIRNVSRWYPHHLFWLWYSLQWDFQERFSVVLSRFITVMWNSSRSVLFACPLGFSASVLCWRKKKKRLVSEISAEMTSKWFWRLIKVGLKVGTNLLKERILNCSYLACYTIWPSKQRSVGLVCWAAESSGFWPVLTLKRHEVLHTVLLYQCH